MSEFKEGLKFGAGVYVGWLVVKWGVILTILVVVCFTVTMHALSRMTPEEVANVHKEQVTYKCDCNVRARPSFRAHRVGRAKAWTRFVVIEKKGEWVKVELPNGRKGWAGCTEKIKYSPQSL